MLRTKPIAPGRQCNHVTCGETCHREVKPKDGVKKPIAKYSKKRTEVNKVYAKQAKAFREANPRCQIKIKGICTGKTQAVHHVRGKETIAKLLDETEWLSSCFACNNELENRDAWARENNLKKSKFAI